MNALYSSVKFTVIVASALLISASLEGVASAQFPDNGRRYTEPAGRGAFLRTPAYSTDELLAQVQNNAALRQRYARHFGVSEAKVMNSFRSTLVAYRLPSDRVVTNYGITNTGVVYGSRTRLKKGTMVWANRSGLPVLKWACANPLTKNLPGTRLASAPRSAKPKPAAPLGAASSPEAELTPAPENELAAAPTLMPPAPLGSESSALVAPPVLSGSGAAFAPAITGLTLGGRGGGLGPGVLLSLLPFFVNRDGGDNGTDTGTIGGPTPGGGDNGDGTDTVVIGGPGGGGNGSDTVIIAPLPGGGGPGGPGGGGSGSDTVTTDLIAVAPEPGTFALFALIGLPAGAIVLRRRKNAVR